jgi:hypothetical protein
LRKLKIILMKKFTLCIAAILLLFIVIPTQLKAVTDTDPVLKASTENVESANVNVLLARLDEIKAMDMSTMNSSEKKDLRKEVRTIKSELMAVGGGVYLSVGALIIIILLLILIL